MRNALSYSLLFVLTLPWCVRRGDVALPLAPPPQRVVALELDRVVRLHVEYDRALLDQYGPHLEEFIREAIGLHNLEWRRYRRDRFELAQLTLGPSAEERDASYVLAKFLHRTAERPDTIHISLVGRALEVYTSGAHATPIGGLAYRGSDAVVISVTPGVTAGLLAYYLFHELGHCWDAHDIPFGGGETTFGSKTRMTFDLDAGNEEIIEDSPGPRPRDTPQRAPAFIREKLARARASAGHAAIDAPLHDLLLHEPSPANPAYVAKKRALLATTGADREKLEAVLRPYELTRQHLRDDAEVRQRIAEHYWRANDAIRRRDYEAADVELQAISAAAAASPDVHMLVGAVERKVRKRR